MPILKEPGETIEILMIEDNEGDARLAKESFADANSARNRLTVVADGLEAIRYLRQQGPYSQAVRPDLILLDLNLPRKSGHEILKEIKQDASLRRIPVAVITSSPVEEDITVSYDFHANCCIAKPINAQQLRKVLHAFFPVRLVKASENRCCE
jgi:CheY-like chemotaxis protein